MNDFPFVVAGVSDYEKHELERACILRSVTGKVEIHVRCKNASDAEIVRAALQARDNQHFYGVIEAA